MATPYNRVQPRRWPLWLGGVLILVVAGVVALLGWLPTMQSGYAVRLLESGARDVLVVVAFGVICCVLGLGAGAARRGTGGWFLVLVGLGFCGFGLYEGHNTWQDIVHGPATVRGPVTVHYTTHFGRNGQITDHRLTVGGIAFRNVADDLYARTTIGSCVVVTYGPQTKTATGVGACK